MNFDLSLERILFLSPSFTFPDEVQDLFGPKLTTHLGFLPLHMYSLDQCTTAASQPTLLCQSLHWLIFIKNTLKMKTLVGFPGLG